MPDRSSPRFGLPGFLGHPRRHHRGRGRAGIAGATIAAAMLAAGPTPAAGAQSGRSPVYVNDSTRAGDLLRRAIEQSQDNTGEAVRQLQELLDEFGERLVPISIADRDTFTSVRRRVLDVLRRDAKLLARHRLVESGEADRLLAAGNLERLIATRPLTAAGLEARLLSGQAALEAARFDEAVGHLEAALVHPDSSEESATVAWSMLGLACHYAAARPSTDTGAAAWYRSRRDEAIVALDGLGRDGATTRTELRSLVTADEGARISVGTGAMDRADAEDFQDTAGEVIWTVNPSARVPIIDEATGGLRSGTDPLRSRTSAAITDDAVYVADGLRVISVDRFTAGSRWDAAYAESSTSETLRDDVIGMRPISVVGDAVVTIVGAAATDSASTNNSAYLVRLEARTGRRVWRRALRRLDGFEELDGLFPHGRPWIADGRVHVLARRLTSEKLLSCYAVTLDLETGDTLWVRHLASVGSRTPVDKPVTSLHYDRGELFVASPVGATACLDAATGEFRWLARAAVPSMLLTPPQHPFEIDAPLVLDGRVVSIRPDRAAVEVRSREDGRLEATVPVGRDTPWGEPDYLLTDGRRIFAVADDVRCFTLELLDAPLWRSPRDPDDPLTPMSRLPEDLAGGEVVLDEPGIPAGSGLDLMATRMVDPFEVAGRVLVAGENLLVPSDVGMIVVDKETGVAVGQLMIGPGGAPAATGAQLVLAGDERSLSWMSLEQAEELLRGRIAELPDEPGPRLSLLRLAVRIGQLDLVLDAARFTMDAVARQDEAASAGPRRDLFEALIAVDTDRLLADEAEARRFFDVLDSIIATDEEQVATRMAEGDWLADRNPAAAISAWQTILAVPTLSATARAEGTTSRAARNWALDRITAVLDADADPAADTAPTAIANRRAWSALAALADSPAADGRTADLGPIGTQALAAFATTWSFTDGGVRAMRTAADRHIADGEHDVALHLLLAGYRDRPTEARAAAVLGRFLDVAVAAGRVDDAARLADAIDARHPNLILARDRGEPAPAAAWIDGRAWRAAARDAAPAPAPVIAPDAVDVPDAADAVSDPPVPGAAAAPAPPVVPAVVLPVAPPAPSFPVRAAASPPLGSPPSLSGPVTRLKGSIIRRADAAMDLPSRGFPTGAGLLYDGDAVVQIDPVTRTVRWRTSLVPTEVELLAADEQTILLWTGDRRGSLGMREAAAIIALDAATGAIRWTTPPIDELLPPAIGGDRSGSRMPNNYAFSPDEVIVRIDGPRILLARRNGVITCLDRELGDVVLWTLETALEELHELEPGPLGIVAAGQRRRAGRPLPQQLVIDPVDGTVRARMETTEFFAPAWVRSDGLGTVVAGTDGGMIAIDTTNGRLQWVAGEYASRGSAEAWSRGATMVIRDRTGDMRALDPRTGRLSSPFGREEDEPDALTGRTDIFGHDRDILALSGERLVRFGPDGTITGRDAIAEIIEPRARRTLAVTEDGWIIMLAQFRRSDPDDFDRVDRRGPTYYTYRVYVLAPDGRVQDDVIELDPIARQVTTMEVVGDTLLMSTPVETLLIPLVRAGVG